MKIVRAYLSIRKQTVFKQFINSPFLFFFFWPHRTIEISQSICHFIGMNCASFAVLQVLLHACCLSYVLGHFSSSLFRFLLSMYILCCFPSPHPHDVPKEPLSFLKHKFLYTLRQILYLMVILPQHSNYYIRDYNTFWIGVQNWLW